MVETTIAKKTAIKKAVTPKTSAKPLASRAIYAVFTTGGKQYRVKVGDKLKIEKITGEYKEGDKITFENVLLLDDGVLDVTIGTPFIPNAEVSAILTKIGRYKTIDVIKYKQKSRYFKKYGHRQPYFEIQIASIK